MDEMLLFSVISSIKIRNNLCYDWKVNCILLFSVGIPLSPDESGVVEVHEVHLFIIYIISYTNDVINNVFTILKHGKNKTKHKQSIPTPLHYS